MEILMRNKHHFHLQNHIVMKTFPNFLNALFIAQVSFEKKMVSDSLKYHLYLGGMRFFLNIC